MMLKKIISVVLSASICFGSVSLSEFADNKKNSSSKFTNETEDTQLKSSNSLGNYIQQMSEKGGTENSQISASCCFFVGNAVYDSSSGKLTAETTQASACMLRASIISDDESKNLTDKYEVRLSAGEKIETVIDIDTARLPQYYTIEVQLTELNGKELCDPFCISTYTKDVQYVINSDIDDFNPEQVVNFDESPQTNFIVLSEDTVKAETTEDTNQLLSADYDKGEFVFENADDTVNNLEEGDHFYIQPNQTDIIAISVDSVKQEDGKTIVMDSGKNIEDMFDLVKFETVAETDEKYFDTSKSEFETDGKVDNTTRKMNFSLNKSLVMMGNDPSDFPHDPFEITRSSEVTIGKDDIGDIEDAEISATVSYGFSVLFNFYKKGSTLEIYFSLETNASIEAGIGFSADKKLLNIKTSQKPINPTIGAITIPTNIPGCNIEWEAKLKIVFEASVYINASIDGKTGFVFNSSATKKFSRIEDEGFEKEAEIGAKGKITIGIECPIGFSVINKNLIDVRFPVFSGFEITAQISNTIQDLISGTPYFPNGVNAYSLQKYNVNEDNVHACNGCCTGTIGVVFTAGIELEVLNKPIEIERDENISFSRKLFDWHYSDPEGFGTGECDNYAYKVTFNVKKEGNPVEKGTVKIDTASSDLKNGNSTLYCKNGEFTYYVYDSDNKVIKSDKITVSNAPLTVDINNTTSNTASGSKKTFKDSPPHVSEPLTTDAKSPEISKGAKTIERGSLGKYIGYILSEDGSLYIYGCGEMNNFNQNPIKNYLSIKEVIIEQQDVVYYEEDTEGKKVEKIATGEITNIGSYLFNGCCNMKSVIMPSTIKDIGMFAFNNCSSVKNIDIGNAAEKIGKNAFAECTSLTSITIPDAVLKIDDYTFNNCASLNNIHISDQTKIIGRYALNGCSNLKEINIPDKVEQIGEYAFNGCTGLTEVIVPDSVSIIGGYAFAGCSGLNKITIGNGINKIGSRFGNSIGDNTFNECYALEEIKIPALETYQSGVCSLFEVSQNGQNAADIMEKMKKYSLKNITVTSGTMLYSHEFEYMTCVKEIVLPDTIERIEQNAFNDCTDLEKVYLPVSLSMIMDEAFNNCNALKNVNFPKNLYFIGKNSFKNCSTLTEINIPDSVMEIGDSAFEDCSNLKKASIGNGISGITTIGTPAHAIPFKTFKGCYALKELEMPALETHHVYQGIQSPEYLEVWSLIDLFIDRKNEKDPKKFKELFSEYSLEKITITSGTKISAYEFEYMVGLKEVYLPGSITTVEENAFRECDDLTDVYYDDSNKKWEEVQIIEENDPLKNAEMHYKYVIRVVGTDETDPKVLEPFRGNGDVDGDGVTDLSDLINLSMYLLKDIEITEGSLVYADMTKDGEVDIRDLPALKQVIMGEVLNY